MKGMKGRNKRWIDESRTTGKERRRKENMKKEKTKDMCRKSKQSEETSKR